MKSTFAFAVSALTAAMFAAPAGAVVNPLPEGTFFNWEVFNEGGQSVDYGSFALQAVTEGDKVIGFEVIPPSSPITVNASQNGVLVKEAEITLISGGGAWDPLFIYGITATDFGAPSIFQFTIGSPLIPTITPIPQIKASLGGTITDTTGDGASVTPYSLLPLGPASDVQTVRLGPGNVIAGVDAGPAVTVAATGVSGTFASYGAPADYEPGPTAAQTLVGPPGAYTNILITSTFKLSGGQDAFTANGFVEITPVPEPSTYALLGVGIGMVGFALRRAPRKVMFR